jgi:hypothetical protein
LSGQPARQSQEAALAEFLVRTTDEALEQAFDASTAKAVKFYVDTNILVKNPDAYADSVLRMFGKIGGEVVLASVMKNLCQRAGVSEDPKKFSRLRDCVNAVGKQFRSR